MKMPIVFVTAVAITSVSGWAQAQTPKGAEDAPHHPAARVAVAPEGANLEAYHHQMKGMQDMHHKMMNAKTPQERAQLMGEHRELMRAGVAMMGNMQGHPPGAAQPPAAGTAGTASTASTAGMAGMMQMHEQMKRRVALLEHMMQMMVDRDEALTNR